MNSATYESIFGRKKVRKTWKHTLSPEKNAERIKQMQFCKKVRSALGDQYEVTFYFNPGGVAVWGETWVKIKKRLPKNGEMPHYNGLNPPEEFLEWTPVVEACLSHDFSYIRQWDGRWSGRNHPCRYEPKVDMGRRSLNRALDGVEVASFCMLVRELASKPFVRF